MSELVPTAGEALAVLVLVAACLLLARRKSPKPPETAEIPDSEPFRGGLEVYRRGKYSVRHLAGWYWVCQDCPGGGVEPLDKWALRISAVGDVRNRWIHDNSTTTGG